MNYDKWWDNYGTYSNMAYYYCTACNQGCYGYGSHLCPANKTEEDVKATSVGQIIAALVKAMDERYHDQTKPGVLVSYVNNGFYVVIKRYDSYAAGGRNIVVRTGTNLFEVVKDVARSWLQSESAPVSARAELEALTK